MGIPHLAPGPTDNDDLTDKEYVVSQFLTTISLNCTDPLGAALVAQTGVAYARVPDFMNGWIVTTVAGHLITAGSGTTTVVVSKEVASAYTSTPSLLASNLSFSSGAYNVNGTLSTTPGVTTVATNDRIRVDIGTSPNSAARGLIIQLTLKKV